MQIRVNHLDLNYLHVTTHSNAYKTQIRGTRYDRATHTHGTIEDVTYTTYTMHLTKCSHITHLLPVEQIYHIRILSLISVSVGEGCSFKNRTA